LLDSAFSSSRTELRKGRRHLRPCSLLDATGRAKRSGECVASPIVRIAGVRFRRTNLDEIVDLHHSRGPTGRDAVAACELFRHRQVRALMGFTSHGLSGQTSRDTDPDGPTRRALKLWMDKIEKTTRAVAQSWSNCQCTRRYFKSRPRIMSTETGFVLHPQVILLARRVCRFSSVVCRTSDEPCEDVRVCASSLFHFFKQDSRL
jgi:hypothetical protein